MSEQNKIPCAVAQDLMPLVIDGAASEQSRQAVAQHVAACSACSQIYREMQSAAPAPVAIIIGSVPRRVVNAVINSARRRSPAAAPAASTME